MPGPGGSAPGGSAPGGRVTGPGGGFAPGGYLVWGMSAPWSAPGRVSQHALRQTPHEQND